MAQSCREPKVIATNATSGLQSENKEFRSRRLHISQPTGRDLRGYGRTSRLKKLSSSNIEIRIASRQELDLKLEVGDTQQTVPVTGQGEVLETTSSQRGTQISRADAEHPAVLLRRYPQPKKFVSYMPGVNTTNTTGEITVNGSGARSQEILIDGASNTNPESGGTSSIFLQPRCLANSSC